MKCKPSEAVFDAEWFHQLLREAADVDKTTEPSDYSELHQLAAKASEIFANRIMISREEH